MIAWVRSVGYHQKVSNRLRVPANQTCLSVSNTLSVIASFNALQQFA